MAKRRKPPVELVFPPSLAVSFDGPVPRLTYMSESAHHYGYPDDTPPSVTLPAGSLQPVSPADVGASAPPLYRSCRPRLFRVCNPPSEESKASAVFQQQALLWRSFSDQLQQASEKSLITLSTDITLMTCPSDRLTSAAESERRAAPGRGMWREMRARVQQWIWPRPSGYTQRDNSEAIPDGGGHRAFWEAARGRFYFATLFRLLVLLFLLEAHPRLYVLVLSVYVAYILGAYEAWNRLVGAYFSRNGPRLDEMLQQLRDGPVPDPPTGASAPHLSTVSSAPAAIGEGSSRSDSDSDAPRAPRADGGPAEVAARPAGDHNQVPPYWQRILYQTVVFFVMTVFPDWHPDPRYVH